MWYLPETLSMLPYQSYKGGLVPSHLATAMLNIACRRPEDSRALIEHEGLAKLSLTPGASMAPFVRMLLLLLSTVTYTCSRLVLPFR